MIAIRDFNDQAGTHSLLQLSVFDGYNKALWNTSVSTLTIEKVLETISVSCARSTQIKATDFDTLLAVDIEPGRKSKVIGKV